MAEPVRFDPANPPAEPPVEVTGMALLAYRMAYTNWVEHRPYGDACAAASCHRQFIPAPCGIRIAAADVMMRVVGLTPTRSPWAALNVPREARWDSTPPR